MSKCQATVITCIDFRFVSAVRDFLVEEGLKYQYDLISFPGATLNFEKLREALDVSIKLHSPNLVYLIDHEDCGGYGADNRFERHVFNLNDAKKKILELYPTVEVILGFAKLDGSVETVD